MARDTDRKIVSEAVRLSDGAWRIEHVDNSRVLLWPRRLNGGEYIEICFGVVGQIVTADHNWPGCRNGIITKKRKNVLAIIEGTR